MQDKYPLIVLIVLGSVLTLYFGWKSIKQETKNIEKREKLKENMVLLEDINNIELNKEAIIKCELKENPSMIEIYKKEFIKIPKTINFTKYINQNGITIGIKQESYKWYDIRIENVLDYSIVLSKEFNNKSIMCNRPIIKANYINNLIITDKSKIGYINKLVYLYGTKNEETFHYTHLYDNDDKLLLDIYPNDMTKYAIITGILTLFILLSKLNI
jgi:hypothetical protein